jgi:AraC-like DNA-binding protein
MAAYLWDALVLHVGDGIATPPHAIASMQVVVGLDGPVTVERAGGRGLETSGLIVAPNTRHAFYAGRFAMLWVEPESDAGRRLASAYGRRRPVASVEVRGLDALARRAAVLLDDPRRCEGAWALSSELLTAVAGELPQPRAVHPAIRKAVRLIEARPDSKLPARDLAAQVGLSSSRLQHLFRETTGVPLRRYLMWQRLRRAVVVLGKGASATAAAHQAGFTDSAHLTRVLKLMLGIRPSDFQAFRAASGLTLRVCDRPSRAF